MSKIPLILQGFEYFFIEALYKSENQFLLDQNMAFQ